MSRLIVRETYCSSRFHVRHRNVDLTYLKIIKNRVHQKFVNLVNWVPVSPLEFLFDDTHIKLFIIHENFILQIDKENRADAKWKCKILLSEDWEHIRWLNRSYRRYCLWCYTFYIPSIVMLWRIFLPNRCCHPMIS